MNLFIHGVYDKTTLQTLKDLGVKYFSFDLRARSLNLVPYAVLKDLLREIQSEEVYLTFEDDKEVTIRSFLDLLKNGPFKITLEFRDRLPSSFYAELDHSFVWMFHPDSNWREILQCAKLKGVVLPVQFKEEYKVMPDLWELIERRKLEVIVHSASFIEATSFIDEGSVNLMIDLSSEVESSFRTVSQESLKEMEIWRNRHEDTSRQ